MKPDFNQSIFTTDYSFSSARGIIRTLSDAFSKQFCEVKEALRYAAICTEGRCLYCGKPMYSLRGNSSVPVFSNTIHYDHIYPAIKLNLFEVGNVAIACETCNLAKSSRLPMEYYDIRFKENTSLFIYDRDAFELFLDNMTEPYRAKWPEHYETNFMDLTDEELKDRMTRLLYSDISIASANSRYGHEESINWDIWSLVVKKGNETYQETTAKDIEGRIGYTNEMFESIFGPTTRIEECSIKDLSDFTRQLLLSKYESKNEIQKYRMLIKMLIEVLNEEIMKGKLDGFYESVPTYSKISASKK